MADPLDQDRELSDEEMEALADAALGPEPSIMDDRVPFGDHGSGVADAGHKAELRDRSRGARLVALAPIKRAGPRANPESPDITLLITDRRKKAFVIALAELGTLGQAAARAGWSLDTARSARSNDPEFKARWDDALEFAADVAEGEARRRGILGTTKDVYFKGEVVGKEVLYSDRLLELTLKATRPDKFRDNHRVEVEGKGGVLIIPAAPGAGSEQDWEAVAKPGQAQYRENSSSDGPSPDPT
jgi:hypothetical protein